MNKSLIFFVTGAAGFVGRHVCKLLANSGYNIRAIVRRPDAELSKLGVELWIGDLWEKKLLREAIFEADVIIHCAGDARFGKGLHYQKENVDLTENIIQAAKLNTNNARFVFVSSIGAIDRANDDECKIKLTEESPAFPSSDYGKSKLQAEKLVKRSGIPFSIIRPAMVVGDDMRLDSHFSVFARQSIKGSVFARFSWPGEFSVVHVDDLAKGILAVAINQDAEDNIYFCAGEAISIADFFLLCSPDKFYIPLLKLTSFIRHFIKWMPFTLKALLLPALTASDKKLQALGWLPNYSAKEALSEVVKREKSRLNPELPCGGQTVITGAASGLGRALALYLSPKREHLLLVDKDDLGLKELSKKIKNCSFSVVDLSDKNQVDVLLASSKWHSLNITELYNCAGIGLRGRMQDISINNHRKMFEINVLARIALSQNVIDSMQRRHFGRVVLICSSSAFQPLPFMATYAATNSALLSIGESWSSEEVNNNVHIMTVCPGGMKTNFQKSGGVKEVEGEKLMSPEAVVAGIIEGLKAKKRTLIVSFRSFAMSILARFLSRSLSVRLWYRLMEKMR